MRITRRHFIGGMAACAGMAALPRLALAAAATDKRFLLIILRGGLDGLSAVAPYADSSYAKARGGLALEAKDSQLVDLDGFFALHKALEPWHDLYRQKELAVVHAVASPYRDRSHFDAQDVLENGSDTPHLLASGWLNRAIGLLGGDSGRLGMALGDGVPLVLRGDAPVNSWAPAKLPGAGQDFMMRVQHMYAHDPLLAQTLEVALANEDTQAGGDSRETRGKDAQMELLKAAASFMKRPNGARVATLDLVGWDTHVGQEGGNGRLPRLFRLFADGMMQFRQDMGEAWNDTMVVAVTEFGRTVAMNGSNGSDHGTAGVAFVMGGGIAGGRVIADWPGLSASALYQGRDLAPTTDMRSLFKAALVSHLGLPEAEVSQTIFPGSERVRPLEV